MPCNGTVPPTLTLAQITKLERLPETSKVIGWNSRPPGPIVQNDNGNLRVVKPDGRLAVYAHR